MVALAVMVAVLVVLDVAAAVAEFVAVKEG